MERFTVLGVTLYCEVSKHSKHIIVSGPKLKTSLESIINLVAATPANTPPTVKVFRRDSNHIIRVSSATALLLVNAGTFEGRLRGTRVVYIREIDPRAGNTWKPCYRNTRGACLPPPLGWDKLWNPGLA